MGISRKQAEGMAVLKQNRRRVQTGEILPRRLYIYYLDQERLKSLKVKRFKEVNMEGITFVLDNRACGTRTHDYDVVIGPTADDDTNRATKILDSSDSEVILF